MQISLCVMLVLVSSSCAREHNQDFLNRLVEERDSLILVSRLQSERLDAIGGLMVTINEAVDSIAESENLLFFNADKEGKFSRQDAMDDLKRYELLLNRQQQKINELRIRFGDSSPESEGIIKVMQQQLEAKDVMIDKLKKQLSQRDVDIVRLRKTVSTQSSTIVQQEEKINWLTEVNTAQTKALVRQDEMLNNCYVMISTKKNLESMGIVKKGRIVSDGTLNNASFMKVDIRKAREFAFQAKRPEILSAMPQSSYMLINNGGNSYTLKISDPTAFWGITSYLVIQTE